MMPKEEIYIPPMSINVLDHRTFGRKPIVGVHVIKSLSRFRVDRDNEQFVFSNVEAIQPPEQTSLNMDDSECEISKKKTKKLKIKNLFKREKDRRDSKFKRISKVFGNYNANDILLVEEDIDWWCKYFISIGDKKKSGTYSEKGYECIQVLYFNFLNIFYLIF